jgi:hypothetical protein
MQIIVAAVGMVQLWRHGGGMAVCCVVAVAVTQRRMVVMMARVHQT